MDALYVTSSEKGSGKTAICAGLVAWTFLALVLNLSWMIMGLLPLGFGIAITVFQAVEFSVVGYVAGMLYKEE